jgi:hypothetical protein
MGVVRFMRVLILVLMNENLTGTCDPLQSSLVCIVVVENDKIEQSDASRSMPMLMKFLCHEGG